jgi:hypothetical protein
MNEDMMDRSGEIPTGLLVCRGDGHAIGRVERVDEAAIWVRGCRVPRHAIARLANGRIYLDPVAGRYLGVRNPWHQAG